MPVASTRCLDGKRGGCRRSRVRPPDVELHLDVRFTTPRMKIALVGGIHPPEDNRRWKVVARDGRPAAVLRAARLYPFTETGCGAAREDARVMLSRLWREANWTCFVARVLVEGSWERPHAVTPAWVVEGLERPVRVDYCWD
jgi:hypothetical protein